MISGFILQACGNGLQSILLDSNSNPKVSKVRKKLAVELNAKSTQFGFTARVLGYISVIGLIAGRRFPLPGAISAVFGAIGAVEARELRVVAGNTAELMSGEMEPRILACWSAKNFVETVTRNTLFVGPFRGDQIIRTMNRPDDEFELPDDEVFYKLVEDIRKIGLLRKKNRS